jgi:ubiquinone/menaquinone biosynthesis C-methylase UbiE
MFSGELSLLITENIPAAARQTIFEWADGAISAPIAVLRLMIILREPDRVLGVLQSAIDWLLTSSDADKQAKAAAMNLLLCQHEPALKKIADFFRLEERHQHSSAEDPVARWASLFDALVQKSEEASIALYSLGDVSLLQAATEEVVKLLDEWNFLGPDRVILQIGCGIGRFEAALAGRVNAAYGIDISSEMIAVAQRRCAAFPNVRLITSSGRDLLIFSSQMFDGVYAVDTFPYLHASGSEIVARHFEEVSRVMRPGGDFILMNFSYRGSLAADRLEIGELAPRYGFRVLENGVQPFKIWDGSVWRLRNNSARPKNSMELWSGVL